MTNPTKLADELRALHVVFDGPPGPEAGRFVECETPDGRSVNAGEWHERADGLWELRISPTIIAALTARSDGVERKQFPILGSNGAKVDWQLVQDHGKQAAANHRQTVQRLAERGGLSWDELHAVLHDRRWQRMDQATAIRECRAAEAAYLAPTPPETTP